MSEVTDVGVVWIWPDNTTVPTNLSDSTSTTPAFPTPSWIIPPNPGRSLQVDIAVCTVITFLIGLGFVIIRFYTRWVNRVLCHSDWCILLALLCSAGLVGSTFEQLSHGAGKHVWQLELSNIAKFQRAAWYGILCYTSSLVFTRVSILLLYRRIFSSSSKMKKAILVVMVLVLAVSIWLVATVFTVCVPLQAFWDWTLGSKKLVYCHPGSMYWFNSALHIASDLVIIALPLPILWKMRLPRRQKIALVGVFALGFFVCIVSIVRLTKLIDIYVPYPSMDAFYTSAPLIYWTTVEVNSAISCACIMTLKPLIERVFPRLLSPEQDHRDPTLPWITPINNDDVESHCDAASQASKVNGPADSITDPSSDPNSNHRHPSRRSLLPECTCKRGHGNSSGVLYTANSEGDGNTSDGDDPTEKYHEILYLHHNELHGHSHHHTMFDLEAQRSIGSTNLSRTTTTAVSPTASAPAVARAADPLTTGRATNREGDDDHDLDEKRDEIPLTQGEEHIFTLQAPPRAHLRLSTAQTGTERRDQKESESPTNIMSA